MLNLTRWVRVTHEDSGISFEVRRLNYAEKMQVELMLSGGLEEMAPAFAAYQKGELTKEAEREALTRTFSNFPVDKVGEILQKHVRNVQGLLMDGEPAVATDLLSDHGVVFFALGSLMANANLSASEGKVSSSPSTSDSEKAGPSSDSPATSTGSEGGAQPSTAPASPTATESSSRVA